MVGFKTKKISNPLTLGEKLRKLRESKELSLAEISRLIKVSVKYLEAIEAGKYHKLPGEVYAKSFLKAYAKFLEVDPDEFLSLYETENKIFRKTRKKENDFKKPVEKISKAHLIITPRIIRSALIVLVALIVLIYLGLKFKAISTPPVLVVENPADNLVITDNFIEIAGQVENNATLEINGQQILPDQLGYFKETIDLQLGLNTIEIKAIKRHGTKTQVYRQVVVVDEENNQEEIN